jgi:DNA-binding response OmpR family regulator
MKLERCEHCGQMKAPSIWVDEEFQQISRRGAQPIVALSRTQTLLVALLTKQMPRPLHEDRIKLLMWPDHEGDLTNLLKIHVFQVNKRLAALGLMIRRVREFGYAMIEAPDPDAALVQDTKEAIIGALS